MPDPRRHRLKTLLGIAASVAIAGLALYVLWRTFQQISFADVLANIRAVPRERLLLAAGCAVLAFATLAAYEVVVVRYVKHCIGRAKPVITALIAFPLGHALGQAVLSGSAVRYRMYSPAGFSATEVGATVLLCGLPYVLAFGLLFDLALVLASEQLAPLFRMQAWGVREPKAGDRIEVIGYIAPKIGGGRLLRVEYLFADGKVYGLRSSPAG